MSSFQYYATPGPVSHHNHHGHGGRRRGPPKLSMGPNAQKQQQQQQHHHQQQQHQMLRNQARVLREAPESEPAPSTTFIAAYMESLEQWISFDLDDDIEFCPNLVSESDMDSLSSGSDRSSLAASSPEGSPTQQPQTVAASFLHSFNPNFIPPAFLTHQSLPIHQPSATRAIAIIDPTTGVPVSSPSPSGSPHRLPRPMGRW